MLNRYIGGGRKRDPTTGLRLSVAQPADTVIHLCIVSGLYLGIAVFVVEQGWA
jgi:hypothetical protein